jgi:hypothetical protein
VPQSGMLVCVRVCVRACVRACVRVQDIEREEADRRYKREQRANRLLSISSLPPRMQKHEEEFGNKIPPTADEVRNIRHSSEDKPADHQRKPAAHRERKGHVQFAKRATQPPSHEQQHLCVCARACIYTCRCGKCASYAQATHQTQSCTHLNQRRR